MRHMKNSLLAASALILATGGSALAFPNGPVTVMVPFAAGGGTDLVVRAMQQPMEEALNATVVISNIGGGGGTVGASDLVGRDGDGQNLGYLSITVSTVQPHMRDDLPYDLDSWTPICAIASSPVLFFVSGDSDFETLDDVVAAVQADPQGFAYGSSGPGAITHLSMVAAMQGLGLEGVTHIPFQGTGPAMLGMASGAIQFFGDTELILSQHNLKALGVFADERLESLPDVPTMAEAGVDPELAELYLWGGLFAPAGVDDAVVAQLSDACGQAVASPSFQEFAAQTGTVLNYMPAAEFDAFYRAEFDANRSLVEAAGLLSQ